MTDLQALAHDINNALPQTQCTQCGYDGCAPYARAIAFDGVPINQCPPGGAKGIAVLARITQQPILPLNPANGFEQVLQVAHIVESECIGCTKCIQACPVDAIIGAPKLMHVVLTDLCTGCGLCIPPCPVDCIDMPAAARNEWLSEDAQAARLRFEARNLRLSRETKPISTTEQPSMAQAALARARARRSTI